MKRQELEPPKDLRGAIDCFWHTRIDLGKRSSSFEVVPDGYVEIIFHFGSPCHISTEAGLQPLPSPFMVGLLGQPIRFYTKGSLDVLGIRCFPWTVFDLLGLPSGKDGVRVFEHPIARLQPTLNAMIHAGEISDALARVRQYFQCAQTGEVGDDTLIKAGAAMREAKGGMLVREVAAVAHTTVRTLERKFKQSAGFTVKDVSSLMRFEQARNRLWLRPDSPLADLARELGYADQSHLSREFKRYSGTTPAAFARKAKSEKQATHADFVAFVQS